MTILTVEEGYVWASALAARLTNSLGADVATGATTADEAIEAYRQRQPQHISIDPLPVEVNRWQPQPGETYYQLDDVGQPIATTWKADRLDLECFAYGNVFRTEELATQAASLVRRALMQAHREAK